MGERWVVVLAASQSLGSFYRFHRCSCLHHTRFPEQDCAANLLAHLTQSPPGFWTVAACYFAGHPAFPGDCRS